MAPPAGAPTKRTLPLLRSAQAWTWTGRAPALASVILQEPVSTPPALVSRSWIWLWWLAGSSVRRAKSITVPPAVVAWVVWVPAAGCACGPCATPAGVASVTERLSPVRYQTSTEAEPCGFVIEKVSVAEPPAGMVAVLYTCSAAKLPAATT